MTTANVRLKYQAGDRLKMQLMLADANLEIQTDQVLQRLVRRASRRLNLTGASQTVAHQIAVDLGYYLFCHQYQMPRAAYDLLAVAEQTLTGLVPTY
ncbi:hypothetical protein C5Z25_03350 [Lactobacillus sp. CBA3605]|uniref:hypothetical protein n=1 Tax=Lactobacillus sp. CBA3605 TaxID=2099788 RepID=UPI000CFD43CD|nr:hypothetical protein [Lactobacillus sp. CBA3605]AVK60845.1 hypothetical protein C5Z25_03350 [Lactobacillus sp. CBA3605]